MAKSTQRAPLVDVPTNAKRVLFMGDLHCGHRVGLTPPDWQYPAKSDAVRYKWGRVQRECWDLYIEQTTALGPFDVVVVNGDLIDGKGFRSGGTELITTDRHEQCEMAAECIRPVLSKGTDLVITRGTPYHGGSNEDFEDVVASELHARKIGNQEWISVNGVCFDVRHHIGSSSIPHGKFTAMARSRLWNLIWAAERNEAPKADVIIRSHVHNFHHQGERGWLGITLPALQSLGSKFGAKLCEGTVDWGFVVFDVWKGGYQWKDYGHTVKAAIPKAVVL